MCLIKSNNLLNIQNHGEKDVAVYPEEARRMYARLKEACIDATLTIYPECDHNCWDKTYSNYDNLEWLMN